MITVKEYEVEEKNLAVMDSFTTKAFSTREAAIAFLKQEGAVRSDDENVGEEVCVGYVEQANDRPGDWLFGDGDEEGPYIVIPKEYGNGPKLRIFSVLEERGEADDQD